MAAIETRVYQTRTIENTLRAIQEGHRHILIIAPTGAGKTVMALEIARRLNEAYGYKTGWCAMRKHLLLQASEENCEKIGFKHVEFFSMFNKNPPHADVLINDECQHTPTESGTTIYQKVNPTIEIG